MADIIKNRSIREDSWQRFDAERWLQVGESGLVPDFPAHGELLVPLALWRVRRDELLARGGRLGLLVEASDDPESFAELLAPVQLIAVRIPQFTDGRAYSLARLLRERYGYSGELRATGDVLRDQLLQLERCGFDAFELRGDQDLRQALSAFDELAAPVRRPYAWARAA